MSIWGHYEKVSIQGSKRKANVFVPSLLKSALPPFVMFALPVAATLSTEDKGRSLLDSPWSMVFGAFSYLLFFAAGLLFAWGGACERRDAKRMRNGELVLRTGELFMLSRESTGNYSYRYRFALRDQQGRGEVEIYEMPNRIYEKFCARCCGGADKVHMNTAERMFSRLHPQTCLVDVVVLPPEKGPDFRTVDLGGKLRAVVGSDILGDPKGWQFPLFTGEVADIFYKKNMSGTCAVNSGVLFER